MWPGPRPTCVPSFVLIYPTDWPQYTNTTDRADRQTYRQGRQTDRQTGQRSDSIGRAVLQTVAQKVLLANTTQLGKLHFVVFVRCKLCAYISWVYPSRVQTFGIGLLVFIVALKLKYKFARNLYCYRCLNNWSFSCLVITLPPEEMLRSIAMSVSVCGLYVCLSVRSRISKTARLNFASFCTC